MSPSGDGRNHINAAASTCTWGRRRFIIGGMSRGAPIHYPKIDPVMLADEYGYWLASYNWDTRKLVVVGYHHWPCGSDRMTNAAQKVVCFLRASGLVCEGDWNGFVENMVCDRWNADGDLHDSAGNPVDGAETLALERLIAERANFLQDTCEFVRLEY